MKEMRFPFSLSFGCDHDFLEVKNFIRTSYLNGVYINRKGFRGFFIRQRSGSPDMGMVEIS
jgi:hypothetical protein